MTLSGWYNRSALALIVLAIAAYSVASVSPEFAVLAGPVVVMLWRLSSRKAGAGSRFLLPRFVVNIMLFAVLAYATLRAQGRLEVETIAQVVVLIQIIKIGDRRAPKDDAQILCLAVFLAIAAMLDSNSVWTGVLLMMFLPLLVTTVMLFQLHQGEVQAAGAAGPTPAVETSAVSIRRGLRATSAAATVGTLGFALVVFVLMPRGIGENAFGSFGSPSRGRVQGFTSSVTLGAQGILSSSPTIVFDLVVRDSSGQNIGSEDSVHYMRGAVLTQYENSKWTGSEGRQRSREERINPGVMVPLAMRSGPTIEQTITMRSPSRRDQWQHMFATWAPTSITFNGPGTLRYNDTSFVLQRRSESGSLDYSVVSVPFEYAPKDAETSERSPVSIESEAIRQLAVSIMSAAKLEPDPTLRPFNEDTQAARAIQDYLRTNMTYTLELEAPPRDVDPVEHFLFQRKRGHCEYMASAMVLLCRAVGINARMVTGYLATEYSAATGSYIVRESHAHAWAEVEDTGRRWRPFDPTPPADLDRIHRAAPGLFGRLRQAIEAMEYAWNSSIVAFNEQTRQNLLGPTRGEDVGMLGRIERVSQRVRTGGPRLMLNALTTGVIAFIAVASFGIFLQLMVRIAARRFRGSTRGTGGVRDARSGPIAAAYRRMLRSLVKQNIGKPGWKPPLEHAASLREVDSSLALDVQRVSEAYYQERFSGTKPPRGTVQDLHAVVKRVGRFRSRREGRE